MSTRLASVGDSVTFLSPANFTHAVVQTQGIAVPKEITLVVEATADRGVTWFMVPATAIGRGSEVTFIWTNGRWFVDMSAFLAFRVRVTDRVGSSTYADVDASPGELVTGEFPLSTISSATPVTIESSILLDGQTNVVVTDIQKRRIEELLYLEALAARSRSYEDQDGGRAADRGFEVR